MVIRLNKRTCFYVLLTILILLLMIRYSFQIEIPRTLLTATVVAIAMFGDRNEIVAIVMGCVPLHSAIDFYIAVVACAIILIVKNYNSVKIGFPVFLIAIMVAWELFHCIFFEWTPKPFLVSLAPLMFIAAFMSTSMADTDYAFIARIMAFITFSMCIVLLMNHIVRADGNLISAFTNLRRLGSVSDEEALVGSEINPNTLGVISSLGITALLQLRSAGQKTKTDTFMIFFLLIFGVLTSSKTFLVCLLILFASMLMGRDRAKKKIRLAGAITFVVTLTLVTMNVVFPELLEYYIDRFFVEDITTGRSDLMSRYSEYITNSTKVMFFGVGLTGLAEKLVDVYNVANNVPHNIIQEIIVAWGIPGLMMVVSLFATMIGESLKYGNRKTILNYIPMIIIMAKAMAGQFLTSGYTLLALTFAYLSLCQDFSQNKKEDNNVYSLGDVTPENNKIFIFRKG